MKFKLFFLVLLLATISPAFSNNPIEIHPNATPQPELLDGGCNIPAPLTFHLVATGTTWADFAWTAEWVIPPTYRLKTYEIATGTLVNTLDVPGSVVTARVQNLTSGVAYRTDIHAVCQDGTENPQARSIEIFTLIQELVVTGFTSNVGAENCTIAGVGQFCELNLSPGAVNVFKFEQKGSLNNIRYFYVDRSSSNGLRVQIYSGDAGSNVQFQCIDYPSGGGAGTYTFPAPSCSADQVAIVLGNQSPSEVCRFEISALSASTSGKLTCTYMNYSNGKSSITKHSAGPSFSPGNSGTDDRNLEVDLASAKVNVAPNPFSNQLDIQLNFPDEKAPVALNLYDLQGRLVVSKNCEGGLQTQTLFTESMAPGMYFLHVQAAGETQVLKVMKTQ